MTRFQTDCLSGRNGSFHLLDDDALQALYDAHRAKPSFLVGYLGYDIKNQLETLSSRNPNRLAFPDAYFVEPEWVIDFEKEGILIRGDGNPDTLVQQLTSFSETTTPPERPARASSC